MKRNRRLKTLPKISAVFQIESGGSSSADDWVVLEFHLNESIGKPYKGCVDVVTYRSEVDYAALVGKHCTLVLSRGPKQERTFAGIVFRAEISGENAGQTTVCFNMAAAVYALQYGKRSRIFENKSSAEIVKEVLSQGLKPFQREVEAKLAKKYPPREFCAQYQESDLSFVNRLMADEGIFYYFDQSGKAEKLVLVDSNDACPLLTTKKSPKPKVTDPLPPPKLSSSAAPTKPNAASGTDKKTDSKSDVKEKKWPVNVKGKFFWNRTWNYNNEKAKFKAVKEFLPGARVELYVQSKGLASPTKHNSTFLNDNGEFEFKNIPECTKASIKILLEHKDNKVICIRGRSNAISQPDFEIKTGAVVWCQFDLDVSKMSNAKEVDFGELEIKKNYFIDVCDAYKTIWFGHMRILNLSGYDLPLCQVNVPEPTISTSYVSIKKEIHLLKNDLKDRDVIMHEYGHFIRMHIHGNISTPGYEYNNDTSNQHSPYSKEHYESAWDEGLATFLSCAINDDPIYHDGYDASLNVNIEKNKINVGPHCEGSVQMALWRIYKVHHTNFKNGFWKAYTDTSKRIVKTIFDFYNNWKDLGLADLNKVVESLKFFSMEYGYKFLDGADKFTAKSKKPINIAAKEFFDVADLYNSFSKSEGGSVSEYMEEFYNRNVEFNPNTLDIGSTKSSPKVVAGKKYIVPVRFRVK